MALTEENIFGSFLPTVNFSKITLNNSRVDLEMVIIDTNFNEGILSIINDKFLRDCITIRVYQSLNDKETDLLEKGEEPFLGLEKFIEIPLNQTTTFEVDDEGNRKFYYSAHFDLDTSKLEHLSYIAFSDIDLIELRRKFGIVLTRQELKDIPKKITAETVIDEFEIVSTSFIYELQDGSIWTGEVININGIYETLEEQSRILKEVEIPNYKIQDFRIRNLIKENSATEAFIKYSDILIQDKTTSEANLNLHISSPKIFESVIKYKNIDNSISISLLVDLQQLVKQNCLFPKLLKPEMINEKALISNMSLYRRQIKSIIKSETKTLIEAEEAKEPALVLSNFKDYELKINDNSKHFLLIDENAKYLLEGIYQYGIRINFLDPTIIELKKKLATALTIRKNILEYYQFCEVSIDSNTNSFKKEVSETWDAEQIEKHAELYLETEFNLPTNFNKLKFLKVLKTNISPINGTLDGIYLFIKIVDDLINDISSLLSVTQTSEDIYEFNSNDIEEYAAKSSTEIFKYFNDCIYRAGELSKLELNYFDVQRGVVSSQEFVNKINENTSGNEELYFAPKSIFIGKQRINLSDLDAETNKDVKKQKYVFLKNKTINIQTDQTQYSDTNNLKFLKQKTNNDVNKIQQTINYSNEVLRNNLFNNNSVIVENQPSGSLDYKKYLDLQKVLFPTNIITITYEMTKVNILKNLTIDLSDEESQFKYLMFVKIQYSDYNELTRSLIWKNLTLQTIKQFKNNNINNLLCKLVQYDYSSITKEKVLDNIRYNEYFMLNLDDFNFESQPVVAPSTEPKIQEIETKVEPTKIEKSPIINLRLPLRPIKSETINKPEVVPFIEKNKIVSQNPLNSISRTNIAVSTNRRIKDRNISRIRNIENLTNNK